MFLKQINQSDIVNFETQIESNVSVKSESLDSVKFISGSLSSSYWDFFKQSYYNNTGSYPYTKQSNYNNFRGYMHPYLSANNRQFFDKYNITASYVGISQKHFGEGIVPETFVLKNSSISSSTTGVSPILKDDGFGNIYATNAFTSQSNHHASHSTNHVGNIFYKHGMVVLKETGSWSGSVSYLDLAQNNYSVDFKSKNTIFTTEYNLRIEPEEFLYTSNATSRQPVIRDDGRELSSSPHRLHLLTGSSTIKDGWTYITTIGLYDPSYSSEPLILARLPKPIRRNTSVPITFKLRIDNTF